MIFRYPGGKTKLLPVIMHHLSPILDRTDTYYEPFVGGGSVVLNVAKCYPDKKLVINDYDQNMAAFWSMVAYGTDEDWAIINGYLSVQPTVELFNSLRQVTPETDHMRAYYAVFFNRCTFSGIAMSGPIGGQGQKSKYTVDCRYNAARLIKECSEVRKLLSGRLEVASRTFQDFFAIEVPEGGENCAIYLDPPYYVKGPELYPCSMDKDDHEDLAKILEGTDNWVLSYDFCDEVKELYSFAKCITIDAKYSISGVKSTWSKKQEYIILP